MAWSPGTVHGYEPLMAFARKEHVYTGSGVAHERVPPQWLMMECRPQKGASPAFVSATIYHGRGQSNAPFVPGNPRDPRE